MMDAVILWYLGLGVFLKVFIAIILFITGLIFSVYGWSLFIDFSIDNEWFPGVWIVVFISLFVASFVSIVTRISLLLTG